MELGVALNYLGNILLISTLLLVGFYNTLFGEEGVSAPPLPVNIFGLRSVYIVSAECDNVNIQEDKVISRFKITHVYIGDRSIVGKFFQSESPQANSKSNSSNSIINSISPNFINSEKTFWILNSKSRDSNNNLNGFAVNFLGIKWPARSINSTEYDKAKIFVEGIEAASTKQGHELLDLLELDVTSSSNALSNWAVGVLLKNFYNESNEHIQQKAKEGLLPLSTLIAVDDFLIHSNTWVSSDDRVNAFIRCINLITDNQDLRGICNWMSRNGCSTMDSKSIKNIMDAIFNNEKIAMKDRIYAMYFTDCHTDSMFFAYVMMASSPPFNEENAAARDCLLGFPVTDQRIKIIEQTLTSIKNSVALNDLQQVLDCMRATPPSSEPLIPNGIVSSADLLVENSFPFQPSVHVSVIDASTNRIIIKDTLIWKAQWKSDDAYLLPHFPAKGMITFSLAQNQWDEVHKAPHIVIRSISTLP